MDAIADGVIPSDLAREKRLDLMAEKERLQRRLDALARKEETQQEIEHIRQAIETMQTDIEPVLRHWQEKDPHTLNLFLKLIFDSITVVNTGTRKESKPEVIAWEYTQGFEVLLRESSP